MVAVETALVVLISSRGLRIVEVPRSLPSTFRTYDPVLRTLDAPDAHPTLRLYLKQDSYSYVEQEQFT